MARQSLLAKRLLFFKQWRDQEGQDGPLDQALKLLITDRPPPQDEYRWLNQWLGQLERQWRNVGILPGSHHALYRLIGAFPFAGLLLLLFLCGIASFYFGSGQQVHLLANPFLALIFWHLGLYAFRLIMLTQRHKASWLAERLEHLLERKAGTADHEADTPTDWRRVRRCFRKLWLRKAPQPSTAEIYVMLHASSLALTCGMIVGLYLNGILRAYTFSWDSTFIHDPQHVETLLTVIFAPLYGLRSLLGWSGLPPLSGHNGAAWIHFYAQAALLYILVPRLLMLFASWRQCAPSPALQTSLLANAKLDQWAHFLAGTKPQVQFIGYSFHMPEEAVSQAAALLEKELENKVAFQYLFLPWGTEAHEIPWPSVNTHSLPWWLVICCNAAQTPEDEIHGALFAGMQQHESAKAGRFILLLDTTSLDPDRLEQRIQDWRLLAERYDLNHLIVHALQDKDWRT